MPTESFANNYQTTLSGNGGSITAAATTLLVASATGAPSVAGINQFRIVIDAEIMIVTAISSLTFTVTRGAEGTTAAIHGDGAAVSHIVTAAELNSLIANAIQIASTTQSGTTYTLALADQGTVIEFTSASATTVTVPPNSSVAFPVGTVIEFVQYGAGQITIAPGAGVTLRNPSSLTTRAQYSTVSIRQRATDTWVVSGDLT